MNNTHYIFFFFTIYQNYSGFDSLPFKKQKGINAVQSLLHQHPSSGNRVNPHLVLNQQNTHA